MSKINWNRKGCSNSQFNSIAYEQLKTKKTKEKFPFVSEFGVGISQIIEKYQIHYFVHPVVLDSLLRDVNDLYNSCYTFKKRIKYS